MMGGDPEDALAPIFIVGAPRSGTSLLRNLLNRHPAIGLCDETHYLYYVWSRRRAFGDLADAAARRRLVDRYLATRRLRRLGIPLEDLATRLERDGTSYDAFFVTLLRFYAAVHHKRRFGEKTPQHAFFVATLCEWYPRCRILHLVRDPRDVVASLLRMPWASRNAFVNARRWLASVTAVERAGSRDNLMRVRYEQLVTDPESELRRICDFVGEEPHAGLGGGAASPPVDAWWFARAAQPVTSAHCGAWRRELTSNDVAVIEWVAAPFMRRFGYEPAEPAARVAPRLRAVAGAAVDRPREKLRQLPRMWYTWARPTQLAAEEWWIEHDGRAEAPDPSVREDP
jgi:Sulfotransferase family